jgi:hypothetical protein
VSQIFVLPWPASCRSATPVATTLGPLEHHELAVQWGYSVLNVGNPLNYGLETVLDIHGRLRELPRPKL